MEPRVVGTVVLIEGVVLARSPDGRQRQLKHGDPVFEGDVITALADAHVELAFAHGGRFLLRSSESVTLNGVLFDNVFGQSAEEGRGTLLGRVAEATDPTRIETEGQPRADRPLDDDGSSADLNDRVGLDLGNGFVRLDRIAEPLPGTPFAFRSADGTPLQGVEYEGLQGTAVAPPMLVPAVGPARPDAPAPGPEVPAVEPAPPLLQAPGAQTIVEDGVLVFSRTGGNPISVSDIDSGELTTTLNVSTGTLTLPQMRGVVVEGNGTDSVTLRGSPDAINRALEGLEYRPLPNDTTTATLTVITSDESRSVGASVQIGVQPVLDAPLGVDDVASTRENTAVRIPVGSLLANDSDPDGGVLSITGVNSPLGGTVALVGGNVVFTPAPGFTGTGGFSYVLSDGQGGTDTVRVVVTVTGADAPDPTVFSGARSGTAAEDGVITGTLRATDADGMRAPAFAVTGTPQHGTATINAATGKWTYTPARDYNGADSFVVRVTDDAGNTATQVISLTVTPVADIANNTVAVAEDASVTSNLLANDSFEGAPIITAVAQGANGTVTIINAAAGTVRYTPDANFHGTDSYTYTVTSGGVTETATVTVNVGAVNDATTFGGNTSRTGAEDAVAITGTLTAADADGMAAPAFTVVGNPLHGTATIDAATGAWSYTPAADYNGADSFTVRVRDDDGNTATRVISLTVTAVADAVNNSATATEDGSVTSNVLGNDSFEGAGPTITAVTSGAHGTVTIVDAVAGTVLYTPDPDFHGTDSYTYTVTSGGVTETATVTVTVTPVDDAGSFGGATSGAIAEDGGAITGTLAAADADGLSTPNFIVTGAAAHGTATINAATGAWTYTPTADYNGADSFTVSVTDDDGNTFSQVISLTVAAVADIADNAAAVDEGDSVTRNLLANDSFENAGATIVGVTQGANGVVTIIDPELGTVRYTPDAGFHGTDTYTYTVTSGGVTETATVTVTVNAVDAPTSFGGATSGSGAEDAATITGTLTVADADGMAAPGFTVSAPAAHGTATIDATTGAWSYVPTADYHGPDSFTVRVTDDDGNIATRVITLTVTPVADIVGDTATVAEDGSVTSSLLGNDSFEATPTITAVTNGAHGTVTIVDAAAGTVLYTPDLNFHGNDSYTYTVTSGGVTETATVTVTVTPVDDATVFSGDTTGVEPEDGGVISGVLSVADADGMAAPAFAVGTAAGYGTATIDAVTGAWSYTPAADYNGSDSFTVTVTDDDGNTATRTISLTVTPVTDIAGDAATTTEDTAITRDVLANDSFESAARSITAVTDGAHGTVTIIDAALGLVRYTPDANYNGTDAYTYTVTAGGVSETVTVNVTITPSDDAVTFGGDTSGAGTEDGGAITGTLTAVDAGDGMAAPAFTVTGAAAHGTAAINAVTGAWSYTPAADYNGADSFTVRVTDDAGNTATHVITLAVGADADIAADAATVAEDGNVVTGVLGNDSFEGAPILTAVTQGANGTVTIVDAAAGTVRYTPDANFHGTDSYTYTVTSGGVTETATVTVTVTPLDDATSFGGNTAGSGSEDTAAITGTLTVLDADGMTAPAFTVSAAAAHGTASIGATGAWTYTPAADYNGPDSFTVTVTDNDGNVATQVISLTVTAVADVANDAATVAEDDSVITAVRGNDSFEGATPAITAVTNGAHGTVAIVDAAAGTVAYTPDLNWHGTDSYTYTVTSGGVTETATVTVTVTRVDDAATFGGAITGAGAEDAGAITGTLTAADAADGMAAPGFTVTGNPAHGTATINASSGAWSYTPTADYNGVDSFTVTVTDDDGNTATQVVSLTVAAVADIAPNSASTDEDTSVTRNLLANDSFEHAGASITAVTQGTNGTVTIIDAELGTVRYTPDANFHGTDSYTYTVTSGGVTETATVTVTVNPLDDLASFGGDTTGAGNEDGGAITGTLTVSDGDGTTTPAFTVTGAAAHGTASIDATTGAWTYTPAADYYGADSFTVRFTDDAGNFATRVISLAVAADPDIDRDAITVAEDGSVTTALFGNDTFEGATPAITAVTSGAHGTVTIVDAAAGTVLYTPDLNFHGDDSYTYTVTSGGVTETATVTVTVTPVDDATAFSGNTTGVGNEDGAAITGVLGVSDADGIASPGFAVTTGAGHGTAIIDPATGAWSYTPVADYNGPDSFTVTVTDSEGHTATRVISVSVVAAVDIAANSVTTAEDTGVTSNLLANDNFDGTPAITAVTNGAHGTVTIVDAAAGTVRYTPDANFHGNDTYTYTVTSGGVTETATVTVTVTPVDDTGSFSGDTTGAGAEDGGAITGTLGATDGDGMAAPAFTVSAAAAHGTATIDAGTGAWTYVPAADYNGVDSFTASVTDDDGNTSTQVISVAVSAVPDVLGDSATVAEDGNVTTAVRGNDSFEGMTPTVTAVTNGAHGTVTIVDAAAGTIRYTPDLNWHGTDSYTYTVTSGGVTETATVSVTVTPVDDATAFTGDVIGVGAEDAGAISGVLSATDADGMADPDYAVTTLAAHGTATIDPITGSWSYTPDQDYHGADSFTVTVTDDDGNTATRTINLSVTPVVDIAGDTATTAEETAITRDLLSNDSFESAGRSITSVTNGSHGTVTIIDADLGLVRYTPDANYNGTDAYTYTVTSGGVSETVTVNVTITPADDAPVFGGDTTGSGTEDGGPITGTLTADDLADGMAAPAFTVATGAVHGTATIDATTGSWSYTPDADYNGTDAFTVRVTDDDGNIATHVISLTVGAVVDIADDTAGVAEDGTVVTAVRGNDSFEGAPILTAVTNGAHGTVTIVDAAAGTVRYTPDADWHGTDTYTYTVTSGGVTETATVTVTVSAVDDDAVFTGTLTGTTTEDGAAITGTLNATDVDGMTTAGYAVTGPAAHGTASINAAGAWTYIPAADYNGADSFTVTVTDNAGNTTTQVISLTVTAVADIAGNAITVAEDGSESTLLFGNDTFEGTPTITAVSQGAHGTVTIVNAATGEVVYTPNPQFNGTDSYTYTVTSGGVTETATVTVTVTPVDDTPTFGGATGGNGNEDAGVISGTLSVADAADGMTAPGFIVTGNPAHGTATIDAGTGNWRYTPAADYNGADSFTVTVTDNAGNTATQVISLTVAAVADIAPNSASTDEDTSVTRNLLANDSFESAAPAITAVTQGAHGTVTIIDASLGTVRYTPDLNWHGTDTYTYTVTSGGVTETATVTVTVNPLNDPTVFADDTSGSGAEDAGAITGTLTVTDADGITTPAFTVLANGAHGTASINAGGGWSYIPAPDYNGPDSFTVRVTDNAGNTSTQVISLVVTPVVDAVNNTISVAEDGSVTTPVLLNDSFSGTPSITAVTNGANGTVTIVDAAAGTVLYTPNLNFSGTDSYTYTVTSGGVTETATVTVTVTAVDDAPVFGGNSIGIGNEDAGVISGVLTATDADGMTNPGYVVSTVAGHGTASIDAITGAWSYIPDADYHGADSFTVTVTDNAGNTATHTINLSVTPVTDIATDTASTTEDTSVVADVLANDSFEGAGRIISSVTDGAHGTVTIVDAALGLVRYTPDANYNGTDAYTYTVSSGGTTETVTVNVTITPVNDTTSFGGTSGSGNEDAGPITGTLTVADADGITAPAFTVTANGAHGTASIDASGAWTYAPVADYNGPDSFTVRVTDNTGATSTQVITVNVGSVVDIADDTASMAEDTAVITAVRGNDTFEGSPTITAVTNGAHGTVTIIDAAAGTVQYTPDANWHGTDTYTYTVTSGGVTETATVTVTVSAVNDDAVFTGTTSGTTTEDGAAITGTLNATDVDGMTTAGYAVTGVAAHGTASINASGAWTYVPAADYNGADSFTVTVTDNAGNATTQVISLTVTAVADIAGNAITVAEDDSDTTALFGNDTFEGTPTITAVSQGANGTVTIVDPAAGTVLYTPNLNFNGTDSYTYTVTSGGVTETATVTVTVTPVDDAGTFGGATTGSGNEDAGTITGTLTAADVADGMAAPAFDVSTNPLHGTATIHPVTGNWSYRPAADYNGTDSFTVTVTDDDGNIATQVITLTVSAVADAVANTATTSEDTSVTTNVLANDSFESAAAAVTAVTQGAHGTVTIIDASAGTVSYTPDANWHGTDTYTYTVTSGGVTETATVTVTVSPVDDTTSFGGATTGTGNEDAGPITGTLTVADGDGITTPAFTVTANGAHGTASINASGAWTYAPAADYNGPDSFTVRVTDNTGATSTQVITVNVGSVVDIADDTASTAEDTAVITAIRGNDTFEGSPTITAVTNGAHGTVTIVDAAAGTVQYTPDANWHGTDTYTYTVTSGGVTETATVTVTVNAVNDDAVFTGATSGTTTEDGAAITGTLNATDVDGMATPGYAVSGPAAHGTATINAAGAWTYIPAADYNGADSFTVTVTDNAGNTTTQVISLTVTAVADIAGNAITVAEDGTDTTALFGNDTFEGTPTITAVSQGAHGTVTIVDPAAGTVLYTPNLNFNGTDSYTYTVTSGGVTETATVTVTVTPVDDVGSPGTELEFAL